jgi:hypothetical protein
MGRQAGWDRQHRVSKKFPATHWTQKSLLVAAHAWEIAMKPDRDPRPGLPSAQERNRTSEPLQRKPEPRLVDLETIRRVVPSKDDAEG